MNANKLIIPIILASLLNGVSQKKDFPLTLNPHTELTIAGSNLALAGLNIVLKRTLSVPTHDYIYSLDRDQLFFIDKGTFTQSNALAKRWSTYSMLTALTLPTALAAVTSSGREFATMGVLGLETYITVFFTSQTIKYITRRPRPEMYAEEYDIANYTGIESLNSFPSRHTAIAFSAAGFVHACHLIFGRDFPWISYLTYGTYTAAVATGFLRYYAGSHHLTDVLAGAVMGWCIGYMIPHLHKRKTAQSSLQISLAIPFNAGVLLQATF